MNIVRVAVPVPLPKTFDYLVPEILANKCLQPGIRVRVPFGPRKLIGMIMACAQETDVPADKLKAVLAILDDEPMLPDILFQLALWGSYYYQYPIGQVIETILPQLLRQGEAATLQQETMWCLTEEGECALQTLTRARQQKKLLALCQAHPTGITKEKITAEKITTAVVRSVAEKSWIVAKAVQKKIEKPTLATQPLTLSSEQEQALQNITAKSNQFHTYLLDGVTGSGKTEVYLQAIAACLAQDKQCLVLIPEIALTPQTVARFKKRFAAHIVVLHSDLTPRQRLNAWLEARAGIAHIIIGTRSAVFTPLKNPGLIIIDEEHDLSFKQQEGWRYSARDIAIKRAQQEKIPIVLGSATPAIETLSHAVHARYTHLRLTQRAGDAQLPQYQLIDVRGKRMQQGLTSELLVAMEETLAKQQDILLFINRRGFAPVLMCHQCGWSAQCTHCDANYVMHKTTGKLHCHYCGRTQGVLKQCPKCQSPNMLFVGVGTQRLEETLTQQFPHHPIIRIDRDTTQRKGALEDLLKQAHQGQGQILIGTQMLAKGHHFPQVTLVGIVDADGGLYSADFRALERLAQLILQVSGRAGRGEHPGTVYVQTRHPQHPQLQCLLQHGYHAFCEAVLAERRAAHLPPYSALALLHVDAKQQQAGLAFLQQIKQQLQKKKDHRVQCLGPIPALQEKLKGFFRVQLLLQAPQRKQLQLFLQPFIQELYRQKLPHNVRWSLDVDPLDLF